jgi:hypothetical protein
MLNNRKLKKSVLKILKELCTFKDFIEKTQNINKNDISLKHVHKWIGILETYEPIEAINEVWKEIQYITRIMDGAVSNIERVKKDKLIQRIWKSTLNAIIKARKQI